MEGEDQMSDVLVWLVNLAYLQGLGLEEEVVVTETQWVGGGGGGR